MNEEKRMLMSHEELSERARRYQEELARKCSAPQQIYASIRPDSKYFHQTPAGERFKVYILDPDIDGFCIVGGPGGKYRLCDVNLYVLDDGKPVIFR